MPEADDERMSDLRRDAIRRAREMQARARAPERPAEPYRPPIPEASPEPYRTSAPEYPHEPPPVQRTQGESGIPGIGGALDFLTKDSERSLVLILLLILVEEKADNELVFALMYLLM